MNDILKNELLMMSGVTDTPIFYDIIKSLLNELGLIDFDDEKNENSLPNSDKMPNLIPHYCTRANYSTTEKVLGYSSLFLKSQQLLQIGNPINSLDLFFISLGADTMYQNNYVDGFDHKFLLCIGSYDVKLLSCMMPILKKISYHASHNIKMGFINKDSQSIIAEYIADENKYSANDYIIWSIEATIFETGELSYYPSFTNAY